MYRHKPYHHRHYHHRQYHHYEPYRGTHYDLLLYEAIRERDRYRDLYYNNLYDVNPCNPYYAEVSGCRL